MALFCCRVLSLFLFALFASLKEILQFDFYKKLQNSGWTWLGKAMKLLYNQWTFWIRKVWRNQKYCRTLLYIIISKCRRFLPFLSLNYSGLQQRFFHLVLTICTCGLLIKTISEMEERGGLAKENYILYFQNALLRILVHWGCKHCICPNDSDLGIFLHLYNYFCKIFRLN